LQTFLPYSDFNKTAKCLDYKRLGKQRVETWQIYKALTEEEYGWKNHPIVRMWKGYETTLLCYGMVICKEWISRGYKDNMFSKFLLEYMTLQKLDVVYELLKYLNNFGKCLKYPSWLGNKKFHASHRSNLLRKNKEYYSQFDWTEPDNLPYVWITGDKK